MRLYRSGAASRGAPVVLHLHGGAFVSGSLDSGRTVATLLADAGAIVLSADYPLAPEHPFPQGLEAAFNALNWLNRRRAQWSGRKSGLFVAGEEAGGNLAASLALMARDQQAPALSGQILLSPMLDPCMATCSMREAEAGPVGCKWADGWQRYLGSPDKAAHPYASPFWSSRLGGVAPALLVTAEDDLLRDESLGYAQRLQDSGVAVTRHVLAAPTGWPDALNAQRNHAGDARWIASVRDCCAAFFADICGCHAMAAARQGP